MGANPAPMAAPTATPTPQDGAVAQAKQLLQLAQKLMSMALVVLDINSAEGKKILSAVKSLGSITEAGGGNAGLQASEMKLLASQVGPEGMAGMAQGNGAGGGMPAPQPRPNVVGM